VILGLESRILKERRLVLPAERKTNGYFRIRGILRNQPFFRDKEVLIDVRTVDYALAGNN